MRVRVRVRVSTELREAWEAPSAAPGDDDLVGLSVLEGRVVDQQGNAMAGGPPAWTNLKPESPEGPGCPWLG